MRLRQCAFHVKALGVVVYVAKNRDIQASTSLRKCGNAASAAFAVWRRGPGIQKIVGCREDAAGGPGVAAVTVCSRVSVISK